MEDQKRNHFQEENEIQAQQPMRRPVSGWQTWLVSLGFPLFHIITLNLAAIAVGVVMLITSGTSLTNLDDVENLLMSSQLQNYASILMALFCCPVYLFFLYFRERSYKGSWGRQRLSLSVTVKSAVAIFGSLGLVSLMILCLNLLSGHLTFVGDWLEAYEDLAQTIISEDGNIILEFFSTVCLVPIAEELLFRGVVLGQLKLRYSTKACVLIQALLFALFHMNPIQSLYTFVPGLVLGIVYCQTNNLLVPIICHMIFNLFGGLLYSFASETALSIITMLEIIFAAYALYLIGKFFLRQGPQKDQEISLRSEPGQ